MPMIASAASQAAAQVGGQIAGGLQFFKGLKDEKKAKAELAALTPAYYKIQDEYLQNQKLAGNMAASGLPQESQDYMTSEAGRGFSSSLSAILQGGASPNDVSGLLDTYNRSINRIGAQDADARLRNIQYYMNTNKDLAAQKTMQWTINEYQPYQNKLKELTQRRSAAEQNKWGGLGTFLGATSSVGKSLSNEGMMQSLFGQPGSNVSEPFLPASTNMETVPMAQRTTSPAGMFDQIPDSSLNFNFQRPI